METLDGLENNPFLLHCLEIRMLRTLKNPVEKFLFVYIYLMNKKQIDAAEALEVHETNIARHMRKMRKRLNLFKEGYEDTVA